MPQHWRTSALRRSVGDVDERVLADPREDADRNEADRLQQGQQLVAIPVTHSESVLFEAPVSCLGANRHVYTTIAFFNQVDPSAQRDLAAGRLTPVPDLPIEWPFVVVEDERASGEKRVVQSSDGPAVLLASAAEAENAAADDRRILSRRVEVVQRRHPQPRARRTLPAALDHVGGRVASVDLEALASQRDEKPS